MSQITITLPATISAKIGHRIAVAGQKEKETHELNWSLNLESNDHQDRNALILNLVQAGLTNLLRTMKPNDLPDTAEAADAWITSVKQADIYSAALETARAGRKASEYPIEARREDCQRIAGLAVSYGIKLAKDFRKLINANTCTLVGVSNLKRQVAEIEKGIPLIGGEPEQKQPLIDAHKRFAQWLTDQAALIEAQQASTQFD